MRRDSTDHTAFRELLATGSSAPAPLTRCRLCSCRSRVRHAAVSVAASESLQGALAVGEFAQLKCGLHTVEDALSGYCHEELVAALRGGRGRT